jgi:SAM-dependent methyltransferase
MSSNLSTKELASESAFVVTDQQLQFFQKYVGPDATKEMILHRAAAAREKALKVCDYRCIREWRFLESRLLSHPLYPSKIRPLLPHSKILDLGCCFGTDIRLLITEGAEPKNILGVEKFKQFVDIGFELFEDEEKMKDRFVIADFFTDNVKELVAQKINEPFDIVYAGSVYHLLLEDQGIAFTKLVHSLLKTGGIFFGQTVAAETPTLTDAGRERENSLRYLHSPASFTEMLQKHQFDDVVVNWRDDRRPQGNKWGAFTFYAHKR